MLRNLKFTLAIVPAILLTSCGTTGGLTQDQLNALVQQIQAFTSQACSFRPAADGVISLIAALVPASAPFVTIVNTVGDAICKAPVTASSVKRGSLQIVRIVQTPKGPVAIKGVAYGAGQ